METKIPIKLNIFDTEDFPSIFLGSLLREEFLGSHLREEFLGSLLRESLTDPKIKYIRRLLFRRES